jgi:hypothetical protein
MTRLTAPKMNNYNHIPLSLSNYSEASHKSREGFSMYFFHSFENLATVAPSMTL